MIFILDMGAIDDGSSGIKDHHYSCNSCKRKYTAFSSLRRHMKYSCRYNKRTVTFKCPICEHVSRRKDNLQIHINTHMKEKGIVTENYEFIHGF